MTVNDRRAGFGQKSECMRDKVEKVIQVIRPAIQADKGDIALRDVDLETGKVYVELFGACVTCPASTQTLKMGVERILKDRVEGVTEVIQVGIPESDLDDDPASLEENTDGTPTKVSPIADSTIPETAVSL